MDSFGNDLPKGVWLEHQHDWDQGFDSWNGYAGEGGTKEEFYQDLPMMIKAFYEYVKPKTNQIILTTFLEEQEAFIRIPRFEAFRKLSKYMKRNHISNPDFEDGIVIEVEKDWRFIQYAIEAAFLNCAVEFHFYLPKYATIVIPTHHCSFLFFSSDEQRSQEIRREVRELAEKYPELNYYERGYEQTALPSDQR